ncbi:MAG: hypothetical protein WDN06_13310 [Asticcacaulis sp.]
MSLVQTVISDIVSLKERGRIQGMFAAVFTSSSIGGPILGGVLAEPFRLGVDLLGQPAGRRRRPVGGCRAA